MSHPQILAVEISSVLRGMMTLEAGTLIIKGDLPIYKSGKRIHGNSVVFLLRDMDWLHYPICF